MTSSDYIDAQLLPYWFAGRVADSTHVEALDLLGNEDAMMRGMLAAEVIRDSLPVTRREWASLVFDDAPAADEKESSPTGSSSPRGDIESWVRDRWTFAPAAASGCEFEQLVLAHCREEDGAVGVGAVWRIGPGNVRDPFYVCVLEPQILQQDGLWHSVKGALIDWASIRSDVREVAENPPFESIRQGWDWPVYYRDMVANSRLIWSASGEDIDLRALAESQPREI